MSETRATKVRHHGWVMNERTFTPRISVSAFRHVTRFNQAISGVDIRLPWQSAIRNSLFGLSRPLSVTLTIATGRKRVSHVVG
jgi:hypothetical protein